MAPIFSGQEKVIQFPRVVWYNYGCMRTVITGQIGMDKKPYLEQTANLAGERGGNIEIYNVGQIMENVAGDPYDDDGVGSKTAFTSAGRVGTRKESDE